MQDSREVPLYLFSKEPVAGRVKTRLMPKLNADRCAALARQMLVHSVEQLTGGWPGERVLCVTPRLDAPVFVNLVQKSDCRIGLQDGADLGHRMMNALEEGIGIAGAAVVMGCDVPYIPREVLQQAWQSMRQGRNVIGPALDGGFYLLGLHNADRHLFKGIIWGENQVYAKLMENAQSAGAGFDLLPTLRDIDLWDDLVWLANQDERYKEFVTGADTTNSKIK